MRSLHTLYLYAALIALTVAAYLPIWNNNFVDFDDEGYIPSNPHVTNGFTWAGFCWAWEADRSPYRVPVTWWSFQLDAQCFAVSTPEGERIVPPAAVHGQNLFWHAASVALLFGFWQRVGGGRWPSFLVAALFAVHPMHVESVAWAAERKDVLSGFFGLLTLWAYVHYLKKPGWLRYLAVAAAYLLSLLSKPMLLTLPFVLLLLDYWPLRRMRGTSAVSEAAKPMPLSRLILEKMPLFLLATILATATLEARQSHGSIVDLNTISLSARLANALTAYGWYLCRTFIPVRLAVLYPHPYENWSLAPAAAGAAMLLCLTLLCWHQARRRPWLMVGWLWFVGTLVPVIGFAQGGKQAWADRFSYWPHIGLFVALVWGLAELRERFRVPALVPRLAATIVLGWLALLTGDQVGSWLDSGTLWERALGVTTDNDQAHQHLSMYYRKQGQQAQAEFHLDEAVRIQRRRLQKP